LRYYIGLSEQKSINQFKDMIAQIDGE